MYGLLLTIMVVDAIFLAIVILLQSGKGGGLAAVGGGAAGTEMLLGGRQAATILTRATWVAGGVFMFLAVVLSILSSRAQVPQSILQDVLQQQAAPEPQPLLPFLGDSAAPTQTPPPPSGP
ncbi:MAG: preprotein translocase subunit SecG [Gemmatimonadetes bacterium]|nr:preprotein translocase subunit SecG [Gemmatimonadota bacterium]